MNTLYIDLNSLHESKGNIRPIRTAIEIVDITVKKCVVCDVIESQFCAVPDSALLTTPAEFSLLHFTYNSTERGTHSFEVKPELHSVYNNSRGYPNSYSGWNSYPDNAFVFLSNPIDRIPRFWAVRGMKDNQFRSVATVYGGASGLWDIITDTQLYPELHIDRNFLHKRCKIIDAINNLVVSDEILAALPVVYRPVVKDKRFADVTVSELGQIEEALTAAYAQALSAKLQALSIERFINLLDKWNAAHTPDGQFCEMAVSVFQSEQLLVELGRLPLAKLSEIDRFLRTEAPQQ